MGRVAKAPRPTNYDVADAFRELLTEGCPEALREESKPWRAALWKAFNEVERRLCPVPREMGRPKVETVDPLADDDEEAA